MAFWIKELNIKKVLLTSIIFTIISLVVHQIAQQFPNLTITSLIFTFVTGISITLIYCYLKDNLPTDKKKRVFYFADVLMGTYFVFFTLPVYLMFNVPVGLLVSWFISTFVIITLNSWMLVKIIK